jgi:hypothetical protein
LRKQIRVRGNRGDGEQEGLSGLNIEQRPGGKKEPVMSGARAVVHFPLL